MPSMLQGLSEGDLARIREELELRHFPRDSVVIAEGDFPRGLYIIRSGRAQVSVEDRGGDQQAVNVMGPGEILGEVSLFTGKPASATVRALEDLEVLVLSEEKCKDVAAVHPRLYQNLGVVLSQRLTTSTYRLVQKAQGQVTTLRDYGAP